MSKDKSDQGLGIAQVATVNYGARISGGVVLTDYKNIFWKTKSPYLQPAAFMAAGFTEDGRRKRKGSRK